MLQLSRKHSFHEIFDSQGVFRLTLEAVSNPARTVSIGPYANKLFGGRPAMLALAMTLLDNETCFNVRGDQALAGDIVSLTLARECAPDTADFVFVCDAGALEQVIQSAKCGTLADPHKSATVIVQNDGEADCRLALYGPGIDGQVSAVVSPTVQAALRLRDAQYYEYPQGIDLIFVTGGALFAIPRLVRWEVR